MLCLHVRLNSFFCTYIHYTYTLVDKIMLFVSLILQKMSKTIRRKIDIVNKKVIPIVKYINTS